MALAPLAPAAEALPYDDAMNVRDYWRVLVRRRLFILGVVSIVALAAVCFTLQQPAIYQSTTTLMPLAPARSGLGAGLGELGGLLPLAGFGRESPTDRLLAVLRSRTLAREVIQHLELLPLLFVTRWDAARQEWRTSQPPTLQDAMRRLEQVVSITASRQGVITIVVEYTDPVLAAAIANSYVRALQRALSDNAFSLAKKNRLFIAAQLDKTRLDLDRAEEALKQFEQTHKIVALDDQTSAAVKAISFLEEQIMTREVQLGVQQRLLKGASREVYLLEEELRGLRTQLARLQNGAARSPRPAGAQTPRSEVWIAFDEAPEVKLQYVRLQREAQIQGKLFSLLAQHLEQAKIEEARDETAFQVLDRALPPERKSKPHRALTVVLATLVGAFGAICLAFFREYLDATVHSREQVELRAGLPVLAAIPADAPARRRWQPRAAAGPFNGSVPWPLNAPMTEALRYLHTRLRHLNGPQPIHTVLLASAGPDDDTALLAIRLGMVAAGTGESTLLVDANLRRPRLHSLLHCRPAPGLAEMLATPEHWQQGIQQTTVTNLHLVAAGVATASTSLGLETPAFDLLLAEYRAIYSLILCLAPALPTYTDAAVLGHRADATCLVLTCDVSRLDTVLAARQALEAVQARVVGAILTACDSDRTQRR